MKNHRMSTVENMMINILENGSQQTWQDGDLVKDALKRCEKRKIFTLALQKINKG